MTLSLDHQQRLNLCVLLGLLECRTVRDMRNAWRLMDRIGLDEQEKLVIEYTTQTINGNEVCGWNPEKSLPARPYELDPSELEQVQKAINNCPRYIPGQMRRWIEPLLAQMPEPAESNGDNPKGR